LNLPLDSAIGDKAVTNDAKLPSKFTGRYIGGSFFQDDLFIEHLDFFCDNTAAIITDSTFMDVSGCEGFYHQHVFLVKLDRDSIEFETSLVIMDLKEINNPKREKRTCIIYTNEFDSKGLLRIKHNFYGRPVYRYLIHEDFLKQYALLQCESKNGPCMLSKRYFKNLTTDQILKEIELLRS